MQVPAFAGPDAALVVVALAVALAAAGLQLARRGLTSTTMRVPAFAGPDAALVAVTLAAVGLQLARRWPDQHHHAGARLRGPGRRPGGRHTGRRGPAAGPALA